MTIIAFSSSIGPVSINCILSEKHTSEIEITENPIETGAKISDHAYIKPKKVALEIADQNATATYNALIAFQESRVPFYLVTGLKVYSNMLVKAINPERDKIYSNVLRATVDLQEVLIVDTATASVDVGGVGETSPGQPGGKKSLRAAPPSKTRAGGTITKDRATGTVQRGDARVKTVPPSKNESILFKILQ